MSGITEYSRTASSQFAEWGRGLIGAVGYNVRSTFLEYGILVHYKG